MDPAPVKQPQVLSEEERHALSRRRIFYAIVGVDVVLGILFVFEIIDLFVW